MFEQKRGIRGVVITLSILIIFGILLTISIAGNLRGNRASESNLKKQYVTNHYNYSFDKMLKQQIKSPISPQTGSDGSWYDASEDMVQYYANPENVNKNSVAAFQFLKLSGSSEATASQLDDYVLDGKGVLENKGTEFKKASEKHDLNEVYLVTHALHETGNGASELAEGVEVGENEKGEPTRVTSSNREDLKHIETTYNFFGIGADDSKPVQHGSERAYEEEWFSQNEAIVGGAQYIDDGFVSEGQDTLYKMRWNPDNPGKHQYATDVGWAMEQTDKMKHVYDMLQDAEGIEVAFEIPEFDQQPKPNAKPVATGAFHVDEEHKNAGKKRKVTEDNVHFREGPTTEFTSIKKLSKGKKVKIIGENKDWYKVKKGKQKGWICGDYVE